MIRRIITTFRAFRSVKHTRMMASLRAAVRVRPTVTPKKVMAGVLCLAAVDEKKCGCNCTLNLGGCLVPCAALNPRIMCVSDDGKVMHMKCWHCEGSGIHRKTEMDGMGISYIHYNLPCSKCNATGIMVKQVPTIPS